MTKNPFYCSFGKINGQIWDVILKEELETRNNNMLVTNERDQ